ncbi:MAG: hypothetical protein HKN94_04105 [Acidimicrobiales bacterium]|nr:hypothetical protein [Acidimicrobiales bacterium]RZV46030.1 MAG: hypothetical protein EX269_08415 [Acidimicrobiales bacterium]
MTLEHHPRDNVSFTRSHDTTIRRTAAEVTALTSRVDLLERHYEEMPDRAAALDDEIETVATSLRSVLDRLGAPRVPDPETEVIDLDEKPTTRWHHPPSRRGATGWQPVVPPRAV